MIPEYPLVINQGASFTRTFNQYGGGKVMAPIEDVSVGYPTVIKVTAHGLPQISTTPVNVSGVRGATDLNTKACKILRATYVDADHFSMPVSTVGQVYKAGSGEITWYAPTDLTSYTARMHIRVHIDDTAFIHELTTENGGITLTPADGGIVLLISATDTATFDFTTAVYDLEIMDDSDFVTRIVRGQVTLVKEVTR